MYVVFGKFKGGQTAERTEGWHVGERRERQTLSLSLSLSPLYKQSRGEWISSSSGMSGMATKAGGGVCVCVRVCMWSEGSPLKCVVASSLHKDHKHWDEPDAALWDVMVRCNHGYHRDLTTEAIKAPLSREIFLKPKRNHTHLWSRTRGAGIELPASGLKERLFIQGVSQKTSKKTESERNSVVKYN